MLQENNSENMQSNDASQSEMGKEDPLESNEESDVDKISVAPEVPLVTQSVVLEELLFEDVTVNSWVLVLYEGEKFLGRCLSKINGKFRVQCLSMPYGIRSAQVFEKEVDVVYYDKVYKPPIFPWAIELDDE